MKAKNWIISIFAGLIGGAGAFLALDNFSNIDKEEEGHKLVKEYKTWSDGNYMETAAGDFPLNIPDVNFSESARASLPSVVHITSFYNQRNYTLYDFIFGSNPQTNRRAQASGSGVIISSDGYIVTNNHVIDNSKQIKVVLNDRRSYEAKLVGVDATTDLALLKIDEKDLQAINYGDSEDLEIGEWVLAVGNPFNLTSTVTAGIVSAKARDINIFRDNRSIESFIQTDAAVNPGNSGGALVNTDGELVGINTAIASKTGSFVGYSFAIPVNIVRKIVADLIEYGEVQRAYMGLSLADVDSELAKRFDLDNPEGIIIAEVTEGGAADQANIKAGDIINEFNGKKVNSVGQLLERVSKYRPGDKIKLGIKRGKKQLTKKLTLKNKYGDTELVKSTKIDKVGAKFEALSLEEKRFLRLKNGVKIIDLYSGKLMEKGVKEGFIITSINQKAIKTVADIKEIIENTEEGESILIQGIYPNGNIAYYAFKL